MQHITDLSFLAIGQVWPPEGQAPRLKRYADNKLLWQGDHDAVYGNWYRVLREDKEASLELVFNWHKRITTLWADLMLSEPPRFLIDDSRIEPESAQDLQNAPDPAQPAEAPKPSTSSEPPAERLAKHLTEGPVRKEIPPKPPVVNHQQEHLDRIIGKDDNAYVTTLQETLIDTSRYGDGVQKITLEKEGAAIWVQPPAYWFPVVAPTNLRRYTHHVLAWEVTKNDEYGQPHKYLWVEIHHKGQIEYRCHRLDGQAILGSVPPSFLDPEITEPVVNTGVDDFLVVPFHGLRASDEIFGVDDYKDLDSVMQAIEVRAALINWILDKHSDPSMAGPHGLLQKGKDGKYVFEGGGQYFAYDASENETAPEYITWDGQLESAFNELEWLIEQLYIISETTPAAFGMQKEGLAESGSALRRLMMAPLAKVARMTMRFDPAARKALKLASMLEAANNRGTPVLEHIQIQWQDGLPADPLEQAQTEQIRTGNKPTTSQVSATRRIDGGTQEEAEAEVARINEEADEASRVALAEATALAATQPQEEEQVNGAPPSSGTKKKEK